MYLEGVKCEQSGRVVDAIRHYKRAMQLVPDIEQKMYGTTKTKGKTWRNTYKILSHQVETFFEPCPTLINPRNPLVTHTRDLVNA